MLRRWDEAPPSYYDPPVMLNPGDTIDWTSTYSAESLSVHGGGTDAL